MVVARIIGDNYLRFSKCWNLFGQKAGVMQVVFSANGDGCLNVSMRSPNYFVSLKVPAEVKSNFRFKVGKRMGMPVLKEKPDIMTLDLDSEEIFLINSEQRLVFTEENLLGGNDDIEPEVDLGGFKLVGKIYLHNLIKSADCVKRTIGDMFETQYIYAFTSEKISPDHLHVIATDACAMLHYMHEAQDNEFLNQTEKSFVFFQPFLLDILFYMSDNPSKELVSLRNWISADGLIEASMLNTRNCAIITKIEKKMHQSLDARHIIGTATSLITEQSDCSIDLDGSKFAHIVELIGKGIRYNSLMSKKNNYWVTIEITDKKCKLILYKKVTIEKADKIGEAAMLFNSDSEPLYFIDTFQYRYIRKFTEAAGRNGIVKIQYWEKKRYSRKYIRLRNGNVTALIMPLTLTVYGDGEIRYSD